MRPESGAESGRMPGTIILRDTRTGRGRRVFPRPEPVGMAILSFVTACCILLLANHLVWAPADEVRPFAPHSDEALAAGVGIVMLVTIYCCILRPPVPDPYGPATFKS